MQEWHFAHHGRFAAGGLAAAFVEATGVTREGRITYGCTGIWEDGQLSELKRVAALYKSFGVIPGIQIGHAGRRGSALRPWDGASPIKTTDGPEPAWQTVGPSPVPEREGSPVPKAIERRAEIEGLVERIPGRGGPRRSPPVSRSWRSMALTAISSIPSSRRSAIGAAMNSAAAWKTACASCSGSPTRCARSGPRTCLLVLPRLLRRQCGGRACHRGYGGACQGAEIAGSRRPRLFVRRHVWPGHAVDGQDQARLSGRPMPPRLRRGADIADHGAVGAYRRAETGRGDPCRRATPISSAIRPSDDGRASLASIARPSSSARKIPTPCCPSCTTPSILNAGPRCWSVERRHIAAVARRSYS